jgi:hypothetical protein
MVDNAISHKIIAKITMSELTTNFNVINANTLLQLLLLDQHVPAINM